MKKKLCIYCGKNNGVTKDHVPPRCFFEKRCPGLQRITVPCCDPCRLSGESNDAKARNLIISTELAEPHRAVHGELAAARNRSFDCGQLDPLMKHAVLLPLPPINGTKMGLIPAFDFDSDVIDSFLLRVTRALLHVETCCGFVECHIERWRANPPSDVFDVLFASKRSRQIGDVFSYSALLCEDSWNSVWLLTFYERLHFFVNLRTTQMLTPTPTTP
jgi:hypothetical protein